MQSVKIFCYLIILLTLMLNIPQALPAKTVSDAAGIINDDKIIKDFVGDEDPGEPYKYFDVPASVFLSILPVYSGSWSPGFTPLGLVFVLGKAGGLAGLLGIYLGAQNFSMTKTNSYTYGFYSCLALFVYSTIGDMIYSGIHVNSYNKEMKKKSERPDDMGKSSGISPRVIVSLEPRSSLINDQPSRNEISIPAVDGIDISVVYRF